MSSCGASGSPERRVSRGHAVPDAITYSSLVTPHRPTRTHTRARPAHRTVPRREVPVEPTTIAPLSPALCRLLNAALINGSIRDELLRTPRRAATRTALAPELAFGCTLPDPMLRLPAISLDADDWDRLGRVRPTSSLADVCRQLMGGPANGEPIPFEPERLDPAARADDRWAAAG